MCQLFTVDSLPAAATMPDVPRVHLAEIARQGEHHCRETDVQNGTRAEQLFQVLMPGNLQLESEAEGLAVPALISAF